MKQQQTFMLNEYHFELFNFEQLLKIERIEVRETPMYIKPFEPGRYLGYRARRSISKEHEFNGFIVDYNGFYYEWWFYSYGSPTAELSAIAAREAEIMLPKCEWFMHNDNIANEPEDMLKEIYRLKGVAGELASDPCKCKNVMANYRGLNYCSEIPDFFNVWAKEVIGVNS